MALKEIDTYNRFLVSVHKDEIVLLRALPQRLTPDQALLLAAYLVCFAEPDPGDESRHNFDAYLDAVKSC